MKTKFIAATHAELANIENGFVTGIGKTATKLSLQKFEHTDLVISVGIVGALTEQLKLGDIVIPAEIMHYSNPFKRYKTNTTFINNTSGLLVTTDGPCWREEKIKIKKELPESVAVDMETGIIAEKLYRRRIPFVCIKAVSDELNDTFTQKKLPRKNIKTAVESYIDYLHKNLRQYL